VGPDGGRGRIALADDGWSKDIKKDNETRGITLVYEKRGIA
jgi:hypothetical protein